MALPCLCCSRAQPEAARFMLDGTSGVAFGSCLVALWPRVWRLEWHGYTALADAMDQGTGGPSRPGLKTFKLTLRFALQV